MRREERDATPEDDDGVSRGSAAAFWAAYRAARQHHATAKAEGWDEMRDWCERTAGHVTFRDEQELHDYLSVHAAFWWGRAFTEAEQGQFDDAVRQTWAGRSTTGRMSA